MKALFGRRRWRTKKDCKTKGERQERTKLQRQAHEAVVRKTGLIAFPAVTFFPEWIVCPGGAEIQRTWPARAWPARPQSTCLFSLPAVLCFSSRLERVRQ